MNITILANRDIASNLALNHLLPNLAKAHRLTVFLSSSVGGVGDLPRELAQLKFFEQTLFNEILFPALAQAANRGERPPELLSFAGLARYTRAPPATLNRINSQAGLATLAGSEPDLVLCIRYGGILKDAAIALPQLGVINLHSGLLPEYRGVMASFRALLNADRQLGTTLHYISDATIDTGDIIGTTSIEVDPARSYLWHVLQLYPAACALLADTVEQLSRGEPVQRSPQPVGGNYYSFPTADELARFHERGLRLYDVDEITQLSRHFLDSAS